jgi:hypothetical protein
MKTKILLPDSDYYLQTKSLPNWDLIQSCLLQEDNLLKYPIDLYSIFGGLKCGIEWLKTLNTNHKFLYSSIETEPQKEYWPDPEIIYKPKRKFDLWPFVFLTICTILALLLILWLCE